MWSCSRGDFEFDVSEGVRDTLQQEEKIEFYGGTTKEPKVLADVMESIMGVAYLDCGFDVNDVWVVSFFFTI